MKTLPAGDYVIERLGDRIQLRGGSDPARIWNLSEEESVAFEAWWDRCLLDGDEDEFLVGAKFSLDGRLDLQVEAELPTAEVMAESEEC